MISCLAEKSEYIGDGLWRWSVFLPTEAPLHDVQEVIYKLHPTFTKPVRRILAPASGFVIEDITSCQFTVYARVIFKNGTEQLLEKLLALTPRPSSDDASVPAHLEKPVIVVVDDDHDVLRALMRDLNNRYR